MTKIEKFPKPLLVRARDCEAHTRFLIEAIERFKDDPIYYKQIAAELRVLVADKNPKNRVLLSLMKDLHVTVSIHPPALPPHAFHVLEQGEERLWEGNIPAEVYCERGFVANIRGRRYTVVEFVRMVAQQEGSSHESTHLDETLAYSHSIMLGGAPSHVRVLMSVARNIKMVAIDFLSYIVARRAYPARYEWVRPADTETHRVSDPAPVAE